MIEEALRGDPANVLAGRLRIDTAEDGFSGQNYFPEDMPRREFYRPVERGFELSRMNTDQTGADNFD